MFSVSSCSLFSAGVFSSSSICWPQDLPQPANNSDNGNSTWPGQRIWYIHTVKHPCNRKKKWKLTRVTVAQKLLLNDPFWVQLSSLRCALHATSGYISYAWPETPAQIALSPFYLLRPITIPLWSITTSMFKNEGGGVGWWPCHW